MKAFYTHGHLYQVNRTRHLLAEQARELGCVFAFMDIHMLQKYEYINGVHVINPEVYLNLEVQWKNRMRKF